MGNVIETLRVGSGLGNAGLHGRVVGRKDVANVSAVVIQGGWARGVYLGVKEICNVVDFA